MRERNRNNVHYLPFFFTDLNMVFNLKLRKKKKKKTCFSFLFSHMMTNNMKSIKKNLVSALKLPNHGIETSLL